MRKRVSTTKFSRKAGPRRALVVGTARSLFDKGKIRTTETRAKEVARFTERLVSKSRAGDLAAVRQLSSYFDKPIVTKIVKEIAPKFKDRTGGYTRVTKLGQRKSDGARMAVVEFVE